MSELFTELSDQQQELVAGGFSLRNINETDFTQKFQSAGATGFSQSGRYGSAAGGTVFGVSDFVDTEGKNTLKIDIPGYSY